MTAILDSVFKILSSGLSIWEHKEKTKYVDKLMLLKQEYQEVKMSKPMDHNKLTHVEFELQMLGEAWSRIVDAENSKSI